MRSLRSVGPALFVFSLSLVSILAAQLSVRIECLAGCGGPPDGTAKGARLSEPFGVAFDQQGNYYICEYKGQRITKVDARGTVSLFAGGENGTLRFNDPHGLVIGRDQQMYVADTLNHRAIRIDLKTGQSRTIAGTGQAGYSGDGGPAISAAFNQLYAVDLNRAGDRLYLTDLRNRRIRSVDLKSGLVTTIAGNGQEGVPKDGAIALESPLVDPRACAVNSKGRVYILERGGNALRLIDDQGRIRTVIGPGQGLNGPKHLCVDRRNQVIIADTENHLIRKYDPRDGTMTVIAGTGEKGDRIISDEPLKTQLNRPHGVLVHPSGALYIADSDNHRVLKLSNW